MPAVAFDVVDEVTPKSFHTGTEGCDDSRSVIEEPMKRIHSYTIGAASSTCTLRVSRDGECLDIQVCQSDTP